jgi:hypothetical protein
MALLTRKRPAADDVRRIALAALTAALDDGGDQAKPKRFKGVRTLAAGAALYTAGVAAFKNRDAILERLREDEEDFDDEEYDEDDGPVAEDFDEEEEFEDADEDVDEEEDEYEDGPEAEQDTDDDAADEDYEDGDDPEDGVEEDFEEDDDGADDSAGSRPPVRADRGSPDEQDPEIPEPPSRPRAPVGRR